jgi:hypothetical protein
VATKRKFPAAPARHRVDWPAVERDFRTGAFTLRELASKYGCSHVAIGKQARKNSWRQDLSKAVRAATNATVLASTAARVEVAKSAVAVTATVLAAAEVNKNVILGHRADIKEARNLVFALLAELRSSAMTEDEKERLVDLLTGPGAEPEDVSVARRLVTKALGTAARIGGVKALAEAITKLQIAERKAFGLDASEDDRPKGTLADELAAFVGQLHSSGGSKLPIRQPAARA